MSEDLSACAHMNLRKAARLVSQFFDQRLRPSGLRTTQFTLLVAIGEMGPIATTALANEMGMERTTLTRNVRVLEREKLVEIHAGDDARERLLALTPEGERRIEMTRPYWEEAQAAFLARFGRERWELMRAELDGFADSIADG